VAVGANAPRRLGGEVEQGTDGPTGLLARPQLQDLAQQHQDGDDGGGLVVDGNDALGGAEADGENRRQERRHQAEQVGRPDAHGDQAEHVEPARKKRPPAALQQGPPGPQDDGRRQRELYQHANTRRDDVMDAQSRNVRRHLQDDEGHR